MGNSQSCCIYSSHRPDSAGSDHQQHRKGKKSGGSGGGKRLNGGHFPSSGSAVGEAVPGGGGGSFRVSYDDGDSPYGVSGLAPGGTGVGRRDASAPNLQHISEREPDDWEEDPSLHPTTETMFMEKSKQAIRSKFTLFWKNFPSMLTVTGVIYFHLLLKWLQLE